MNEDENEMVEIRVPVAWARQCARGGTGSEVSAACKAALDARKSLYERWREGIRCESEHWRDYWTGKCRDGREPTGDELCLVEAAPQLLDAIINSVNSGYDWRALREKAIRAALPADVAAEILGES